MKIRSVDRITWGASTDPSGRELALVIYSDETFEYIPHEEF